MSCTIGEILKWDKSQIGVTEKKYNEVIYNLDYYGKNVNGQQYAWCCVFQWDGFRLCNASELFYDGGKTASCGTLFNWAKAKGLVVTEPMCGDLVEFTFKGKEHCHIGKIVGFDKTGKYLYSVEGNTSGGSTGSQSNGDCVAFKKRPLSQVYGYIRPKYKEVPTKVVTNDREITVWSAPAKLDACRVRTIQPQQITVYDEPIVSFTSENDIFYRTIKGKFVLAKYCK